MNKIKLLAPNEAQKIAAGEVIERPANIVKELIENSLDAQAKNITIYIEKSGKQLIRIIDDGYGMSARDARMCFLPYATSKITSIQELELISSFGFRGEALASIAAISKIQLITRQSNIPSGIQVDYTDGSISCEKEIACNIGTDLSVTDLFYNVPVRKKFLKQDETEWNQIQSLVYAFCISNPSIFFKLFHDNKLVLNAPPGNGTKDRCTQIWDFNFTQHLVPLLFSQQSTNWFSITGYVSNHHFWRYGKNNIFFFVNNRWIKNQELSKALLKGYYNVLPPGKYPAAVIMLTVDKNFVDVNCHPKKEEVRFIKPGIIENALITLVKQALEQNLSQKILPVVNQPSSLISQRQEQEITPTQLFFMQPASLHHLSKKEDFIFEHAHKVFYPQETISHEQAKPNFIGASKEQSLPTTSTNGTIIGQLFNTYILIDNGKELILIDQHAAHERILYEKLLKNFEEKAGTQLLFPEVVALSKEQLVLLMPEKTFFAQQGVELEQTSSTEIIIKTAPPQLHNTSIKEFVFDAIAFIEEHEHLDKELFRKKFNEHVHSHMACKAAIKAGNVLTVEQMQKLVQSLNQTEKRFICIHGRPTIWSIDKLTIEKQFRRK
jgi:DNA mismatch repair protein MutL